MPVEYKLRTLRRLFGPASFFRTRSRVTSGASQNAAKQGSKSESANLSDYPSPDDPMDVAGASRPAARRVKGQQGGPGGVPRAFFQGVPPRSIRNKTVASQLNIVHMFEKQKMRVYYGAMRDGRFRRYVEEARKVRFNVDAELMRLLEMRLDTMLYRTGFVETPAQARQWICHNQILINGSPLNIKSARLRPGDVLSVRDRYVERALEASERNAATRERLGAGLNWLPAIGGVEGMLPWLVIDRPGLAAVVTRLPDDDEARALCRAALFPYIRDAHLSPTSAMRAYR